MEQTEKRFRKRSAILECLRSTDTHPSADWIFQQLKESIPDLSLGTVYRNLTLFRKQGMIVSVGTVQGVERFDGDVSPHAHCICDCCGRVQDLPGIQVPQTLVDTASMRLGGEISGCQLTFSGICKDCREDKIVH